MRVLVDMGCYSLDLYVAANTDFESRFRAICNETGEALIVCGWLADRIDVEDDTDAFPAPEVSSLA